MAVRRIAVAMVWLLGCSGVVHGQDLPPDEEDLLDGIASTQGSYGLHEKGIERLNEARIVTPLSVDTVFGDQVSRFDGTTEFQVTDISIPGNDALPVELRRTLKIDDRSKINGHHLGGFAEWDLELPRLSSEVSTATGWRTASGTVAQRCSVPGPLPDYGGVAAEDYWGGYSLHVPGAGGQQLLMNPSTMIPAAGGGPHPWITKDMWRIGCKSATKNGYAGQAFTALSPDGITYHFDWVVTRDHSMLRSGTSTDGVLRQVVHFLVSRVEDRFGNWVDYTYSGDKLTGITASDGRQIGLTWSGDRIASATSSIGSWSYAYVGSSLSQVTRPDTSKWTYASTGALAIHSPGWTPPFEDPTGCPDSLEPPVGNYSLAITAPSGATGHFAFGVRQHIRSNSPAAACVIHSPQYWYMKVPRFHWSLTLVSKQVTGPGLPAMSWSYTYGAPAIFEDTKQNTISGPDGTWTRYTFGTGYSLNEGQLLKTEQGGGPTSILRTVAQAYVTTAEAAGQNFPASVGTNPRNWSDPLSSAWLRPQKQTITTQQGINFISQVGANCGGKLCFNLFAQPTEVQKHSTLPGNPSKTEVSEYAQNYTRWVLNQPAKLTCKASVPAHSACNNGATSIVSQTTYDPTWALPTLSQSFGRTVQSLTYDTTSTVASGQRGTVRTVADGKGNTITLTAWKRGVPQSIKYPATPETPTGATQSAVVDNAGWITSVTDENGYQTGYGYDAMGRLASVTYPTGDSTTWSATTQAFQQVMATEYGIPTGHWRQTVATGNGRKITYFDGLWRPLLTREYDAANEAGTQRFRRFAYDHAGRTTFASYPATGSTPTTGIWSGYNTIGQPTSVSQDSELGLLTTTTAYENSFQTRVTNPKLKQTVTRYLAWDQPTTELPTYIEHPEAAFTHLSRDAFGKPTLLRRSNSSSPTGGTVAVNRSYVYDAHQQLCKQIEPETGATVMSYNAAGNLLWSAGGQALPSTTSCDTASVPGSERISRSYDARNRLTALTIPGGNGSQSWTWTPDGLPASVVTWNDGGNNWFTNSYSYNRRRLMTGESQTISDGHDTWSIGYGFNANGHLASLVYPAGLTIDYAPNALGQPTRAGNFATGVSYHPGGAVKQFTYGNGLVFTMVQNDRQLPDRIRSVQGSLVVHDDSMDYDHNGNVAAISDALPGQRGNRTMSYDGLDRLSGVTSPMFTGGVVYGYDVLDNLKRVKAPGRDHTYHYDGSNRLHNVTNTVGGGAVIGLGYDVRGNLANKNGQSYVFDHGNRLRSATGLENYRYDAEGRRIKATTPANAPIYSVYSKSGQLLFQRDERVSFRFQYVYLGSQLIGLRRRPIGDNTETLMYYHTDSLGSNVAITDPAKNVIQRSEYEPYGRVLNRATNNRPGFTGHLEDAVTGLSYMQQRYYDPAIGRFLSVDPVTAYANPVSQFHRYRYANNNPYKFTDPDGRLAREQGESDQPSEPVTIETVTVTAPQPVTLGSVTVTAPRAEPMGRPISWPAWISAGAGAWVSAPFLFLYSPHPCGGELCGELTMESKKFPRGYMPGPAGAREWGRRHGIPPEEAVRIFHRGIKGQTNGARADHEYGVNPDTGDVVDPNGDSAGNLEDGHG